MSHCIEPDPFPTRLIIEAASRTDVGRERAENQDRIVLCELGRGDAWVPPFGVSLEAPPCGFFALVCDGMGGEAGGEIAASLAVEVVNASMLAWWTRFVNEPASARIAEERLARAMKASIDAASARIHAFAREHPRYARMGTTATLAALGFGSLLVAQVGDSRAYLWRQSTSGGRLVQLTRDQTMAELIRAQMGPPGPGDPNAEIVGAHVILQAVGASTKLDIVLGRHEIVAGDVVLLCSDGLSGPVDDGTIAEILQRQRDLEAACEELVARANANGGPDNVSCIAFRVG